MIKNKDRSDWIGASDTSFVMGNYETPTFKRWWMEKLGWNNDFKTKPMLAGSFYEHRIIDAVIPHTEKDKQILIPEYRLRVNLDASDNDTIYEIKTYKYENGYKVSKSHFNQVQAQMWAAKYNRGVIIAYGLEKDDYTNYFNDIDADRVCKHEIKPDPDFIRLYLPRLEYLKKCMDIGKMPKSGDLI